VTGFKLPLALSLTAHAILLALLVLLPIPAPPVQLPPATGGIEVAFAPSLPEPEKPPTPQLPIKAEPPPPPVVTPPPPPPLPPPPPAIAPPPPAQEAAVAIPEPPVPPPPPPKPEVPRLARPALRRPERERPPPSFAAPMPSTASVPQAAFAPTPAPAPARAPSTEISPGYRALLSEWLETHKRYPESAREQGEQGRAVLRFVVERSGRVADFTIVTSSGYPDLDAALERMMRGATLPPFPADMDQSSIEVSVAIRFSLGG
jgi:periplasmic protein TonB